MAAAKIFFYVFPHKSVHKLVLSVSRGGGKDEDPGVEAIRIQYIANLIQTHIYDDPFLKIKSHALII